ncbi:MAG: hypothetical protein E6325_23385 [Enterobacteriaceae bacterium]|nr:hypothetical protein [Enterobacteriaceae bacterium]
MKERNSEVKRLLPECASPSRVLRCLLVLRPVVDFTIRDLQVTTSPQGQ